MASSSSYILFSQTSRPFGTRDLWGPLGLPGDTAGSVVGLINGTIADFCLSAFNAFAGTDVQRADWALLALGPTADATVTNGRAFDAPAGPRNPDATLALDPAGAIVVQLAHVDWNGLKNLELFLTTADLADGEGGVFGAVIMRNVVDVRVRIGDGPVEPDLAGGVVFVEIANVKRGEIDARESPHAMSVDLSLTSNGPGWGNTFAVFGSDYADALDVRQGSWNAASTTLDGFRNLANDGRHSLVVADLGAGNDRFDAGPFALAGLAAVRAHADIRMGTDDGGGRRLVEGGIRPPWTEPPFDPASFTLPGPSRDMLTLFLDPVADASSDTGFVTPRLAATIAFLLNGTVVANTSIDLPGGQVAVTIDAYGQALIPKSIGDGATFYDQVAITFGDGNEAVVITYGVTLLYGVSEPDGDRVICSDGADVLRHATGDGFDIVERFDPSIDRIVLEGIARQNTVVLGDIGGFSTELGFGALILTDLASLPPVGSTIENVITDAAIFLPGTSAAAVEAALIFV